MFDYQHLDKLFSNTYLPTNALASPLHPMFTLFILLVFLFVKHYLYYNLQILSDKLKDTKERKWPNKFQDG